MIHRNSNERGIVLVAVIALIVILLLLFVPLYAGYNRAIRLDEQVKSAWGQVENQLQRRYDLVPNLVQTVKGYAAHERDVFETIATARKAYFQAQGVAEKAQAANQLESALSRLLFLQERYPNLKANESFLKLQDQLEGTENRIAVERMRYNEAVRELNTYARSFFGRYFASWAGVSPGVYFKAPEATTTAPQVQF